MSSSAEVIASQSGVVLKKISLMKNRADVFCSFTVSCGRTPEEHVFNTEHEAIEFFEAQVLRGQA